MEDLPSVIQADNIEQYGNREDVGVFGVDEEPGDDVFPKVVSVAEKAGFVITSNDVSICYR